MKWMEESGIKPMEETTEGIAADYVWWNADILMRGMNQWASDFQRIVKVMDARHKEHLQMIAELLEERKQLKDQLKAKE